ncbi:HTH-type transcriptional repressor of iron proteins A [compost metagenome]
MHHQNEIAQNGVTITAITYAPGETSETHCHRRGQLVYAVSGVMEVNAHNRQWRVPPQRAVWIPPRTAHSMVAHGAVELRTLYTPPEMVADRFTKSPLMIAVSPLLRELVLRGVDEQATLPAQEVKRRIVSLAISELELLLEESLHSPGYNLPLPSGNDKRLAQICGAIMQNPGHPYGLEDWAQKVFTSKRTLARRFQSEFGMSFVNWRQQVRVAAALTRLDQGEPVTVIATDLGYETPAAFSLMFRKLTGLTPSSYASVTSAHH